MNTNRGDQLVQYAHPQHNQLFPNLLDDFTEAVKCAPGEMIARGIAAVFRTEETSFAEMVAKLFLHSDAALRVGLVNILVRHIGEDTALSNAGLFGLDPRSTHVTAETTGQLSPAAIGVIAAEVARRDSRVVDEVSRFYAQHTRVVSKLGAQAMLPILAHVVERDSRDLG